MPKATLTTNNFEGGMNKHADPRDIGGENNNELVSAVGVDTSITGKIRTVGSGQTSVYTMQQGIHADAPGYGLHCFSADYDDGGTVAETDYVAVYSNANLKFQDDSDGSNCTSLTQASLTAWASNSKAVFFSVDGGIRMCDSNFANDTDGTSSQTTIFVKRVINDAEGSLGTAATGAWVGGDSSLRNVPNGTLSDTDGVSSATGEQYFAFQSTDSVDDALGWADGDADSTATNSTIKWNCGVSLVYDDYQETAVKPLSHQNGSGTSYAGNADGSGDYTVTASSGNDLAYVQFNTGKSYCIDYTLDTSSDQGIIDDSNYNRRQSITHIKLYMKKTTGTSWFLMAEIDLDDTDGGIKWPFDDEYIAPTTNGGDRSYNTTFKLSPPTAVTYRAETGYDSSDVKTTFARYKSAVVVNRRTYIGNVLQNGGVYGDRMIKTGANAFDIYPEANWLDVVINDGDNITKLEAYADRIFQFKKKNLYIINVSDDVEFLEGQYANYGIQYPTQSCVSSQGVFWANEKGAFRYDGEAIEDISAGKIPVSEWGLTSAYMPSVIYNELSRKLYILPDVSSTNSDWAGTGGWVFDMVNAGWTKLPSGFFQSGKKSNFQVNSQGYVYYSVAGDTTLYRINDTVPGDVSEFEVITKDFTLEDPSREKKFYKLYVTYKANAASNVKVSYSLNGDDDAWVEANAGLPSTAGGDWSTVVIPLKVKGRSISYKFHNAGGTVVPGTFEINDISFSYRMRSIK